MNGTAHVAIGGAVGFIVSNQVASSPTETLILIGIGGVAGLMPDLDVDGKLRSRITFSHKVIQSVAQLIGILMIFYSIFGENNEKGYIGIAIGAAMLFISSIIKQRHMLLITGIGVLAGGVSLQEIWLLLLGVYILVASFVPHRSYTHSILGVIFFGIIAYYLDIALPLDGVFEASLIGYISHLVADSKFLPFNKRGIKLFLPFSSVEV